MIAITINSLIVLFSASTFFYMAQFCNEHKYEPHDRIRYYILAFSLIGSGAANILMVLTYGSVACYFFYAADKFLRILFIGELVLNAENIINIPDSLASKFVSFLTYSSIAVYFLDTIINGGTLKQSVYGIYSAPVNPYHRFVYVLIYAIYIIVFTAFIIFKVTTIAKKREKFEIVLLGFSFGICIFGLLAELFVYIYFKDVYIPATAFNFFSLVFMFHLIVYHRSIQLRVEDFEEELLPNKKDIVFILDDEFKVAFINKRAEVMSIIVEDSYIGRRIDDIFEFTEENLKEIRHPKEKIPFGSSAEYKLLNKHVNIVFDHIYDRYGEVFSSCVTLYNMEPKEMLPDTDEVSVTPLDEIRKMYDEAREMIKGKKVLIIDEDIQFLNELQNSFEPYDIKISRAVGGRAGVEMVRENEFDIVFIADGMKQYESYEVAAQIRKMEDKEKKNIPLILVTGTDINDIFMKMLDAGFTDYISKPIQLIQLNSALTRWLWKNNQK